MPGRLDGETEFLLRSLELLEQRLERIEGSPVFRFTRTAGRWVEMWQRKLRHTFIRSSADNNEEYERWVQSEEAALPSLEWSRAQVAQWPRRPLISIRMAVEEGELSQLEQSIQSVRRQSYKCWQLCLCARPGLDVNGWAAADPRVTLGSETGEYVGVLKPGDLLHPHALYGIAEALQDPQVQAVYSDEDCVDGAGRRSRPLFKPDWSPDLIGSPAYPGNLLVVARDLAEPSVRGLTEARAVVRHVDRVLYHRGRTEPDAATNAEPPLRELSESPLVSLIVCSRNERLYRRWRKAIDQRTSYRNFETVLVEHRTGAPSFRREDRRNLIHTQYEGEFNFSAMNNLGAGLARGAVLIFLNDDTAPLDADWLLWLLTQLERPQTGIVGARLLYPSGAIQHAGIALGMMDGAGHPGRGLFQSGLFPWMQLTRNVSAVTGACLGIRKAVFEQLGGFDPQFPVNYNDVDLCLRARQAGYEVVCESRAKLVHHESSTRRGGTRLRERHLFFSRWGDALQAGDPYFPRALDRGCELIRLAVGQKRSLLK